MKQHDFARRLLAFTSLFLIFTMLFTSCNMEGILPTETSNHTEESKTTNNVSTDKVTDAGDNQTEPHVHSWSDWVVTKEPTSTEKGEQKRECDCGETETQTIVAIDENSQELDFYLLDDGSYAVAVGKANFLSKIDIPTTYKKKSVTAIASDGFSGCTNLISITLPASITTIGGKAFSGCSNLTNINIPNGVSSIGRLAFANCSHLTNITLPDSVASIGDSAFSDCTNLENITLPDSVANIDQRTFDNCTNLTHITISNSVKSIGFNAFYNCSNLSSITFKGTTAEWKAINFEDNWFTLTPINEILCSDGNISNVSAEGGIFISASGTCYILHPVKIRKEAKESSSTVGTAAWGSAVQLIERNTLWCKIQFTDANSYARREGYIRSELLTADKNQVTLVSLETPVTAKISGLGLREDGTPFTLNIRTTPWNCSQSNIPM